MKHKRVSIFAALVLIMFMLNRYFRWTDFFTERDGINSLNILVQENYLLAVALYILLTAAACVFLAVPGIAFAVIAGMLFGPWAGSLFCLIGTTLGAILSFLAGRYFLKDAIKPAIMKHQSLRKVLFSDKPENEVMLLMITRLLPLFPFNLQNFAYGITDIGIIKYMLATFLFMIPGVLLFTLATAGIIDQTSRQTLFLIVAAIAVLIAIISVIVRKYYTQRYEQQGETDEG